MLHNKQAHLLKLTNTKTDVITLNKTKLQTDIQSLNADGFKTKDQRKAWSEDEKALFDKAARLHQSQSRCQDNLTTHYGQHRP